MRAETREILDEGWREAGNRIGSQLRTHTAVVILADYARTAAFFALGISDSETPFRSVIIADLCESPIIDSLVVADDGEGISDCFTFGISLPSAVRVSADNERLSVIRSGTHPIDPSTILPSRRWKAFSERLLETDTMLLVIAPTDIPHLSELISQLDGVGLAGISEVPGMPHARILASAAHPAIRSAEAESRAFPWLWASMIAASVLVIAAAIVGAWYYWNMKAVSRAPVPVKIDSVAMAASSTPAAPAPGLAVVNPADSGNAVSFSVEILAANTQAGANFTLRRHGNRIPAGTVSAIPVGPDQTVWYKVIGGAFPERRGADSLLTALRRSRIIPDSSGSVIETPFAFLVDSVASDAGMALRIKSMVDGYVRRGYRVYGLIQKDGSARIFTGAFERPDDAVPYADILKSAGLNPVLAYRTGRLP